MSNDPQIISELTKLFLAFCVIAPIPFFFIIFTMQALFF